jgi:hypothetical protein
MLLLNPVLRVVSLDTFVEIPFMENLHSGLDEINLSMACQISYCDNEFYISGFLTVCCSFVLDPLLHKLELERGWKHPLHWLH